MRRNFYHKVEKLTLGGNLALIDPLSDPNWDDFVGKHPYGWITHLAGWKLVLEKTFKQLHGHYIVLLDEDNSGYRAAMPLYLVNSWLTGRKLVSIPFATLSDPLVTNKMELQALLEGALRLQSVLKCDSIEVRAFNTLSIMEGGSLVPKSLYKHHYIELEPDLEKLKSRFHRSCVRQRINRAVQSNMNLIKGADEKALKDFYQLYLSGRKRLSLPPQPYEFFRSMWENFSTSGNIELLLAELNGMTIAGIILFRFNKRVSAEYAVTDDAFQNVSPNHFLFWEAIKSATIDGNRLFDFGRTNPDNINLMEFKSRWGTKVSDITHFQYPGTQNEIRNKEQSFAYNLLKNICAKSPNAVFEMIGNFCYRHMS